MNPYVFAVLSTHAKIHHRLDTLDERYRRLLAEIERKEIRAYADDDAFERLEELKKELLAIRFTSPSP